MCMSVAVIGRAMAGVAVKAMAAALAARAMRWIMGGRPNRLSINDQ
jgi:hypothetical protein